MVEKDLQKRMTKYQKKRAEYFNKCVSDGLPAELAKN